MLTCEGKIAVVTGATSGIGLATAQRLVEEGAIVYPMVRRVEYMEQLSAEINKKGPGRIEKVIWYDTWELETIGAAVNQIYDAAGRIDIFVNNAIASQGVDIGDNSTVVDTSHESMMNMFKAIMGVSAACARAVIPLMIRGGGGSIVNNSSTTSLQADMTRSYYGMIKACVNMLTKDTALQYGRQGIRCNAVLPGFTVTEATRAAIPDSFVEDWLKHAPLRRLGKPVDQANAIVFFASDRADWITGQILEVSGGYGLGAPVYGDIVEPTQKT